MQSFGHTVQDPLGIHARPAGLLARAAMACPCAVWLEKDGKRADAKKVFQLLGLCVKSGDAITVCCEGEGEQAAATQLKQYMADM